MREFLDGALTTIGIMFFGVLILLGIWNMFFEAPATLRKISAELKRMNDREEGKK